MLLYNHKVDMPDKRQTAHDIIDEMAKLKRKGEVVVRFDGSGEVKIIEKREVH